MYPYTRQANQKETLSEFFLRLVFLTKKVEMSDYFRIPLKSCEKRERLLISIGKLGSLACLTSSME